MDAERTKSFEEFDTNPLVQETKEFLIEKELLRPGWSNFLLTTLQARFQLANLPTENEELKDQLATSLTLAVQTAVHTLWPDATEAELIEDLKALEAHILTVSPLVPEELTTMTKEEILQHKMSMPERFKDMIPSIGPSTAQ